MNSAAILLSAALTASLAGSWAIWAVTTRQIRKNAAEKLLWRSVFEPNLDRKLLND